MEFCAAYVRSMRLYYSFVTGLVGWLGVAYYEHACARGIDEECVTLGLRRKTLILAILFLAWGINQIFNDLLGLAEDRINAPRRPMVTGALDPLAAAIVSSVLVIASGLVVALVLEPIALVPFVSGVGLNFAYEWAKGHGALGNLVFGLMIATGTVFGFMASGPFTAASIDATFISLIALVALLGAQMTFYTYFKDHEGDRLAGKRTLVVALGVDRAARLGLLLSFVPTIALLALWRLGAIRFAVTWEFAALWALAAALQIWTGVLFLRASRGAAAYRSLGVCFRAYCGAFAALIGLFDPTLAVALFAASFFGIRVLFGLHADAKA